jgi:hypothetical protein
VNWLSFTTSFIGQSIVTFCSLNSNEDKINVPGYLEIFYLRGLSAFEFLRRVGVKYSDVSEKSTISIFKVFEFDT